MRRLLPLLSTLLLAAPAALAAGSAGPSPFQASADGWIVAGPPGTWLARFGTARGTLSFQPAPGAPVSSLRLVSLLAFRDADGDGRYSLGDPTLRTVPLVPAPDAALTGMPDAPEAVYRVPAENALSPADDGAVALRFTADAQGLALDVRLTPPRDTDDASWAVLVGLGPGAPDVQARSLTLGPGAAATALAWPAQDPRGPASVSVLHGWTDVLAVAAHGPFAQSFAVRPALAPRDPSPLGQPLAYTAGFAVVATGAAIPAVLRWRRRG